MCRALLYAGQAVPLEDLLFRPESALVRQSFLPQFLRMLNLAGFGMRAWDRSSRHPDRPFAYHSTALPIFDRNLRNLSEKVSVNCVLAHVRGVAMSHQVDVSIQNTHPFHFPGQHLTLAHNGDLYRHRETTDHLRRNMRPELVERIAGTTDSEWVYALLLSQLKQDTWPTSAEVVEAIRRTVDLIRLARRERGIAVSSSLNLFITDGQDIYALRYCFDFGCYNLESGGNIHEANMRFLSMWYTTGREFGFHDGEWKMIGGDDRANSIIIASEPLTIDTSAWLEVPEYCILHARIAGERPEIAIHSVD